MRQAPDREPSRRFGPKRGLAVPLAIALALKAAALTLIYLLFFVPAPHTSPSAEPVAGAVLGLSGRG